MIFKNSIYFCLNIATKIGRRIEDEGDQNQLQIDINRIVSWCSLWEMELNADKCHILHFGKRNPRYEYQINGCKVSIVNEQEDLGVIIDDNLNFTSHYVKARNKANKIVGFIKQSVTTRKPQTMVKLFSSLVRPVLEYAAPFWSPHLCKDIDMLENVQRRFTRLISSFENIDYKNRLDFKSFFFRISKTQRSTHRNL